MRTMVDRKELLNAVKEIDRFAAKKSPRRILGYMQITGDKGLTIFATDIEIAARKTLEVKIEEKGSVIIPASQLLKTLNTLKGELVTLESEDNDLHIKNAMSDITLLGEKPEDFPSIESPEDRPHITIDASVWHEMVRKTMFAAATSRTRYALNGGFVQYNAKHKKLTLVATDGKRLAIITRKVKSRGKLPDPIKKGVIVPTAFFGKTQSIAKNAEQIKIMHHTNGNTQYLNVDFGDTIVTTRLIEGHFPDYSAVIPKTQLTTMTIGVKDFDQALQEAMLVTDHNNPAVTMIVNNACLILQTHSPDHGKAAVTLLPKIEGPGLTLGVQTEYMLDFLRLFKNGNAQIKFKKSDTVMTITHESDEMYQYYLMPYSVK